METSTKKTLFATATPNRQQRRLSLRVNHRNHVRQVVPSKAIFDSIKGVYVVVPSKVIFHVKKSNLPRLYPNMSRIKNRK